ncbi:hypothetical protein ACQKND_16125 [Viridibacillus arvi]
MQYKKVILFAIFAVSIGSIFVLKIQSIQDTPSLTEYKDDSPVRIA